MRLQNCRRLLPLVALTCAPFGLACGQTRYPIGEVPSGGGSGAGAGTGGATGGGAALGGAAGTTALMGAGGAAGSTGLGGAAPGSVGDSRTPPVCPIPSSPLPDHPIGLADSVLADRLSQFLWATRADDALVARVAAMQPHTGAGVQALAREMIADWRSTAGIDALGRNWLRFDDAAVSVPAAEVSGDVTDALRASMATETVRFWESLFGGKGFTLSTLLTASYSFVDQNLAPIYGVAAPGQPGFALTSLDPNQRSGILTQAGLLFRKPHISTRGSWVQQVLLCNPLAAPAGESQEITSRPANSSYRQALEASVSSAACAACHQMFDPAGYAFEHYDPLGRWRDTDNGVAVDARGTIVQTSDMLDPNVSANLTFDGAIDLGKQLASSCYVHSCVAEQFLAQALGGPLRAEELPSRNELARAFVASGFNLQELLVLTTGAEAFVGP